MTKKKKWEVRYYLGVDGVMHPKKCLRIKEEKEQEK